MRIRIAVFVPSAVLAVAAAVVAGPLTDQGTQPPLQYPILSPGDCGGCHGGYAGSNNIEPWDTWAGSLMAQASRDPRRARSRAQTPTPKRWRGRRSSARGGSG